MERYLAAQTASFLWACGLGLLFGLLYDVQGCGCAAFRVRRLVRALWDVALCASGLGFLLLLLYLRGEGEVESYTILGIGLGLTLWRVGPSRRVRTAFSAAFSALRRGLWHLWRGLLRLFEAPRGS